MRKRTLARQAALQALYQWEIQGEEFGPQLDQFLADWARDEEAMAYARSLVEGVIAHQSQIDKAISAVARNWSLGRMAAIDRSILRLGAYEMLFREDIPPHVAINEAVDLAKRFSTRESGAFVNGVLDSVHSASEKIESRASKVKK